MASTIKRVQIMRGSASKLSELSNDDFVPMEGELFYDTTNKVMKIGDGVRTPDELTIFKGDKGDTGTAATITVGTVNALSPGSTPTVTNAGTSSAAKFNFGIPRGAVPTFSIGTVTTLSHGSAPTVTVSGTTSAVVLNFGIPTETAVATIIQ